MGLDLGDRLAEYQAALVVIPSGKMCCVGNVIRCLQVGRGEAYSNVINHFFWRSILQSGINLNRRLQPRDLYFSPHGSTDSPREVHRAAHLPPVDFEESYEGGHEVARLHGVVTICPPGASA